MNHIEKTTFEEEELVDAVPPMDYDEENKNNVFRFVENKLEPEEFSYLDFYGVENIEEFEKSGDIWG